MYQVTYSPLSSYNFLKPSELRLVLFGHIQGGQNQEIDVQGIQ